MSVLNTVAKGGAAIAAAYNWLFATSVPLVKAALAGSIVSVASGSAAAASSQ